MPHSHLYLPFLWSAGHTARLPDHGGQVESGPLMLCGSEHLCMCFLGPCGGQHPPPTLLVLQISVPSYSRTSPCQWQPLHWIASEDTVACAPCGAAAAYMGMTGVTACSASAGSTHKPAYADIVPSMNLSIFVCKISTYLIGRWRGLKKRILGKNLLQSLVHSRCRPTLELK